MGKVSPVEDAIPSSHTSHPIAPVDAQPPCRELTLGRCAQVAHDLASLVQ